MARRIPYPVISYGEWTRPRMRDFREQCCDCGLIHRFDFRIVDGKVEFRTRLDDRVTTAVRRTFRFSADEGSPRRSVCRRAMLFVDGLNRFICRVG